MAAPPPAPLKLRPTVDLIPAAGLQWLLEAHPRAMATLPELAPAFATLFPRAEWDPLAVRLGGIDLLDLEELTVANFGETHLAVGVGNLSADVVEQVLRRELSTLEGRSVDRGPSPTQAPRDPIVRLWGRRGSSRLQGAALGQHGFAVEWGRLGPLRVAEAYAHERLRRSPTALQGSAFRPFAGILGPAPLRVFAAGPFSSPGAQPQEAQANDEPRSVLTRASAVGLALEPMQRGTPSKGASLRYRIALDFGRKAAPPDLLDAVSKMHTALATSDLGRLCGLHEHAGRAETRFDPATGCVVLDSPLEALALARGLRAATAAKAEEFMAY